MSGHPMDDLHDRAARALGWSAGDVRSLSMQSLREVVRPVDPDLAREMDYVIQSGAYIRGEPAKKHGRRHATIAAPRPPKLSENQKTMLRMAFDTGRMSSGRYGWNDRHVRSLEKKGLVTLVSKATWDKEWKLTDLGRETAKALHEAWLSEHS